MLKRHFGKIFIPILLSGAFLLAGAAISQGAEYLQIPGLMDLRTTFSDGAYDVETLVGMARQKGFGIVILGDHDLMVMECGLPPLRNLLKKREERNSILRQGADGYLQAIRAAGKRYPDMVIVPGSLSSAFYYWTGHPITGDLTAHNHERRILNVGMERATDYEELPLLHNSHSIRYLMHGLPGIFLFSAAALTALAMIFWPGRWRAAAIIVLTLAVLFIINSDPFRNSPYDAYHGDQGMGPYQLLIDHVGAGGGMTFWNYPETRSGVRRLGPIQVNTRPYPEALLETNGYTGFSALYGEKIRVTEPGGVWDTVLKDYCRGLRDRAVWGIATADFHREGESGEVLGNFQTVFLVREKNKIAVLEALRKGRIYATRGKYPQVARMDEFSVSSADGSVKGISGEDILLRGNPRIRIALSCEHAFPGPAKVRLIRGGEVIRTVEGPLPLVIEHEDKDNRSVGERTYYRMDMRGAGVIVSNPIFVSFSK
jgi:hypothetical protein